MDMLLLPLQIDFMQYALLVAVLVAIPAALLSCFLVLKGWALMGDCLLYTSPSPRDQRGSRMPSSA